MIPLIYLVVLIPLICLSIQTASGVRGQKIHPKLFLYSSELPLTLSNKYYVLRKHVVDVILATQIYDLVFSKIPDQLAKSNTSQYILKYKLRTDGPNSYRIELFLIDADRVQINREVRIDKRDKPDLIYQFRLALYEFVLNRKLSAKEEQIFKKSSKKKIDKIRSQKLDKRVPPKQSEIPIQMKKRRPKNNLPKRPIAKKIKQNRLNNNTDKIKKGSLWELLKDRDKDIPWKIEEKNRKIKIGKIKRVPPKKLNPFLLWANLSLKTGDELSSSLVSHQFHLAWKYVQRDLYIQDIVKIKNEFYSVLGLTAEWIYYFPIHISRLMFRTGMEIDRTIKTTPIDIDGHFLFRTGFGYRLNSWLMPSLYYEQSHLNYANLNVIGEGIKANTHSVKWLSLELAVLGIKTYTGIHFAKTIASSKNGDLREASGPSGYRVGGNIRYFFNNTLFGIHFWTDVEYRKEMFKRNNNNNVMKINKSEYSTRIGVHF